jgi:hypothetical protein
MVEVIDRTFEGENMVKEDGNKMQIKKSLSSRLNEG